MIHTPKEKKLVSELTIDEFLYLLKCINEENSTVDRNVRISSSSELMKMSEVSEYFRVSLVTIHKWRKCKVLPPTIKKGGRVYFLRKQIMESFEKITNVDKI